MNVDEERLQLAALRLIAKKPAVAMMAKRLGTTAEELAAEYLAAEGGSRATVAKDHQPQVAAARASHKRTGKRSARDPTLLQAVALRLLAQHPGGISARQLYELLVQHKAIEPVEEAHAARALGVVKPMLKHSWVEREGMQGKMVIRVTPSGIDAAQRTKEAQGIV